MKVRWLGVGVVAALVISILMVKNWTRHNVFLDLPGERVPLPDASVDTVVSMFTLCTVPGVVNAIRGIGRVVKPRRQVHFL